MRKYIKVLAALGRLRTTDIINKLSFTVNR